MDSISPDTDGLMPRYLRAVPVNVLVRVLNLMMWCESLVKYLIDARTVFLPKNDNAMDPADFRPITISSALARLFHRILAKRIDSAVEFREEQRVFSPGIDGCGDP